MRLWEGRCGEGKGGELSRKSMHLIGIEIIDKNWNHRLKIRIDFNDKNLKRIEIDDVVGVVVVVVVVVVWRTN